jgi:serine phosphatase RsbU (regulator of sigma subunit)
MMNQRRLYRTIESFASSHFKNDKEILKHVLNEIVKNEDISIKGGRIWQYEIASESYKLAHQIGAIEKLEPGYKLPVALYPMFFTLVDQRSVVANETDPYLRKKGIVKYSATGVGEKIRCGEGLVYQYILAFNADQMDQSILSDLNIIGLAVNSLLRTKRIEAKANLLAMDIDKAWEIQQSILPESAKKFFHYDIFGLSVPDRIVGGDFFDYLFTDEDKDRLSIVVGDAASKGFKAAAQALYVVGALRMGISYHTKISALMGRINHLVNRSFTEEQFISMFYAEFTDNEKGLMLYSNAGHNSPVLYHAADGSMELLDPTGQIIGPFPNEQYRIENVMLKLNDVMLIYTDGITEARGNDGVFYGEQRVQAYIGAHAAESAKEICEGMMKEVQSYSHGAEYSDDKTIVVIKRIH